MKQKGFTLLELLVVIAIIGILAAIGVVSFGGFQRAAKVNVVKTQISQVEKFVSAKMGYCMANGGGSMDLYIPENWGWPLMNPGDCDKSTMDQKSGGMVNHIDDSIKTHVETSKSAREQYAKTVAKIAQDPKEWSNISNIKKQQVEIEKSLFVRFLNWFKGK